MDQTAVNNRTSVARPLLSGREADTPPGRAAAYPFMTPPESDGEIGRLGSYRVLGLLGEGGMGLVFEAEDVSLRRPVALKVMKEAPAVGGDDDGRARFLREARAMAAINHEHLLTVYQIVGDGLVAYMAMELLRGRTLEARIRDGVPFAPAEICRVGREVAVGLDAIHARGLIHRDIKPGNLWLEAPGGRVKILDFGLARGVDDEANLTREGVVVGTPAYLSPEQARGLPADPLSDLFSLGCVLYRMCTGSLPFPADSAMAQLISVTLDNPVHVRRADPSVPEPLAALIHRLLAKDPFDRPPSAAAVVAAFRAIEDAPARVRQASGAGPTPRESAAVETPGPRRPRVSGAIPAPPARTGRGSLTVRNTAPAAKPAPKPVGVDGPTPVAADAPSRRTRAGKTKRLARKASQTRRRWVLRVAAGVGCLVFAAGCYAGVRALRKPTQPAAGPVVAASAAPPTPAPAAAKPVPLSAPVTPPPAKTDTETAFLTDLPVHSAVGWPFQPPKRGPGGGGPDFTRVVVNGISSPHGLFMHAADGTEPAAKVRYTLGKQYRTLATRVSLNDTSHGSLSEMTFSLYGDGRRLWTSRPVTTRADEQTWTGSVEGVDVLTLGVTIPGARGGAHGVWVESLLTK